MTDKEKLIKNKKLYTKMQNLTTDTSDIRRKLWKSIISL